MSTPHQHNANHCLQNGSSGNGPNPSRSGLTKGKLNPCHLSSSRTPPSVSPGTSRRVITPPALSDDRYLPFRGNANELVHLLINTMTGMTFRIHVLPTNTMWQVKQIILNQHGIPIGAQTLVFNSRPLRDGIMVYQYELKNGSHIDLVLTLAGGHGPISASLKLPSISSGSSNTTSMLLNRGSQTSSTIFRNVSMNGSPESNSTLLLLCRRDADYYLVEVQLEHGECVDANAQYLGGADLSPDEIGLIVQAMGSSPSALSNINIPLQQRHPFLSGNGPDVNDDRDMLDSLGGSNMDDPFSYHGLYDDSEPIEYPTDFDFLDRSDSAQSTVSIPENLAREFGLPTSDPVRSSISPHLQSVIQSTITRIVGSPSAARPATAIVLTRVSIRPSADLCTITSRVKSAPVNRTSPPPVPLWRIPNPLSINDKASPNVPHSSISTERSINAKSRALQPEPRIKKPHNLVLPSLPTLKEKEKRVSNSGSTVLSVNEKTPDRTAIHGQYCQMPKCTKLLRPTLVSVGATRCRCGFHYCDRHRASDVHTCGYDYRGNERVRLGKENPKIRGKLPFIS